MGGYPTDCTDPGELPPQGSETAGRDANSETDGRDMGLPPDRLCPEGGSIGDDGDLHLQMLEYSCSVHCDNTVWP